MDIKIELLKAYVTEAVTTNFEKLNIDANEIASTKAIEMLSEVLIAIRDDSLTDFEVVEKIVCMFERNGITCLERHDF